MSLFVDKKNTLKQASPGKVVGFF